jgi:cyclophilin family peptidyl-prolyl cis-trans isomerase
MVEGLEDRCLLAAPVIDPIAVPLNLPLGKSLIIPITATDPAGGAVTYTVTSSDPQVTVTPHNNATFLKLTVSSASGVNGVMEFELLGDVAPQTVDLISGMVKNEFYNGLTFHRIVKGFVIQGGDPAGNGTGGPGFTFDDEFNPNAIFSGSGQLAMANSGKDTNGSQFFITDGPQRPLDFNHTIFGQLVRGFDVLQQIENVPVGPNSSGENSMPLQPVVITSAQIVQDNTDAVFTLQSNGTAATTDTITVTATSSTGGSTTQTFQVQVAADSTTDPPILGPVPNQVSPLGGADTFHLTRTDLQNNASEYKAVVDDPTHATATIVTNADNSADVTVTPLKGFTGVVHVLVGVKEKGATSRGSIAPSPTNPNPDIYDTQNIGVAFGDQQLTNVQPTAVSATEGTAATNIGLGTFTDPTAGAVPGDYHVSINWGDGSALDSTSGTVTGSGGNFTVTATSHTYKEAGVFLVKVTITDAHQAATGTDQGGAVTPFDTMSTVADAPLTAQATPVSATKGSAFSGMVATFTDADVNAAAGDFSATITWGDGTTSPGVVMAQPGGGFVVNGSHVYAQSGSFSVGTSITDVNTADDVPGATAQAQGPAAVAAPSGTPNQRLVDRLAVFLLGHPADPTLRNQLAAELDSGKITPGQVANLLGATLEGRQVEVTNLFNLVLGHAPSAAQLNFGVAYFMAGHVTMEAEALLMGTPEYLQAHGGTNDGFLSGVYQQALNRSVDATGQANANALLAQGGSRADVARNILFGPEAELNMIQGFYQMYLGHSLDVTAFGPAYVALPPLNRVMLLGTILDTIFSSPELLSQV